jgi:hypothetical protein
MNPSWYAMRLAERLPHPLVTATFLLAFAGYSVSNDAVFGSPDMAWHLAAGDWILAHHHVPTFDPWSYTAGTKRWFNISWLWDTGLSLIFRIFGAAGIYFFTAAFGALNVAVVARCLKARGQVNDIFILLTAIIVWLVQKTTLVAQPILMTFLLCQVFHHILHGHRRDGLMDVKRAAWLMALMVLWVNTHGGFIAGFSVLAAYGIEACQKKNWPFLRVIARLVALCGAVCFINPYHIGIIPAVLGTLRSVITPYLNDWRPFTFGILNTSLLLVLFILTSNVRDPNIRLPDKILAFAWLIAGLATIRNFFVFAFFSPPYLSWNLQEFARATQCKWFRVGNFVPDSPRKRVQFFLMALAVCGLLLVPAVYRQWVTPDKFDMDPYGVAAVIPTINAKYPNVRFINDYNLGGYLIYHSGGTWRVFVDGRANTAYPEDVLKDTVLFNSAGQPLKPLLKKYAAQGIIVTSMHNRAKLPRRKWKEIFRNEYIVAYEERIGD